MRAALLLALCSSCTFAHVAITHRDSGPAVALSPKMQKLDDEERTSPLWCFVGDQTLLIGGFMAGPMVDGRVDRDLVQPINVAGLVVSGLVFASLGATVKLWGHL